jgi:hypothetical protein
MKWFCEMLVTKAGDYTLIMDLVSAGAQRALTGVEPGKHIRLVGMISVGANM